MYLHKFVSIKKDVLLRMNMKLSDCRGQCYDGASTMTGSKCGAATQLQSEETCAVLTHCYGHALNLAVGSETVKQSKACQNALDLAYEVSKLAYEVSKLICSARQSNLEEMKAPVLVFKHSVAHAGLCKAMPLRESWRTTAYCNSCETTVWT